MWRPLRETSVCHQELVHFCDDTYGHCIKHNFRICTLVKYVGLDLFEETSENKSEIIPNTKFSNPLKNIYFNYIKKQNPYSLEAVEELLKKFKDNAYNKF